MSFDNLCKLLSEKYPANFASWVLNTPQTDVEVLKTELSIEPIRADSVTFLQLQGRILHLEFQTQWRSKPPLPLRMLDYDYWVRLYRLYRLPITQVVVLLLPPPETEVIETRFTLENTDHQYQVIRLWEENPELFLHDPALLPLAPLTATNEPQTLLQRVIQQVNELEEEKRTEISAYAQIVAGLKYEKDLVKRLFREGMMRESVIYQDIIREGREEGEQRERSLILRQLTRQVGELPQPWRDAPPEPAQSAYRVNSLSLEQLEKLGEALLDFQGIGDLETWWDTSEEN